MCWEREGNKEYVPGCEGNGASSTQYCIMDPANCDQFQIVVNNAYGIPDVPPFDGKNFSSYNAPSLNKAGFVVFRARSTG